MEKYLSPAEDASANSPNLVDNEGFPYPIPAELAKEFDPSQFGELWKRNCPHWAEEHYVDPQTGEPTWEYPFFVGITYTWLLRTKALVKLFATRRPPGDKELDDGLMLSILHALDDLDGLHRFTADTWKYDPMIREEILGEAPVSPDNRPLRAVNEE